MLAVTDNPSWFLWKDAHCKSHSWGRRNKIQHSFPICWSQFYSAQSYSHFVSRHIHPSPASTLPNQLWSAECPPVPSYQTDTVTFKWDRNHDLSSNTGQETSLLNISLYSIIKVVKERKNVSPGWMRILKILQKQYFEQWKIYEQKLNILNT